MEGMIRCNASWPRSSQEERIPVRTPPQRTTAASMTTQMRSQRPPDYMDTFGSVDRGELVELTISARTLRTLAPPRVTSKGTSAKTSIISVELRRMAEIWRFRKTSGNAPGLIRDT